MNKNPNRPLHIDEKIVAAAVHSKTTWSLPRPARHHTILNTMIASLLSSEAVNMAEQGFLTSEGRFVGRELAKDIAWKAGQCEKFIHSTQLFSEDLW